MIKKKVYIFPGIGQALKGDRLEKYFLNKSEFKVTVVNWIEPKPKEKFNIYLDRIIKKYTLDSMDLANVSPKLNHDYSNRPVFLAVSFGGLLATRLITRLRPAKIIYLSPIKNYSEIRKRWRLLGRLISLLPESLLHKKYFPEYLVKHLLAEINRRHVSMFINNIQRMNLSYKKNIIDLLRQCDNGWIDASCPVIEIKGKLDRLVRNNPTNVKNQNSNNLNEENVFLNAGHLLTLTQMKEIETILDGELGLVI